MNQVPEQQTNKGSINYSRFNVKKNNNNNKQIKNKKV